MSENSSNHYNSFLYLSDFEVPSYLKSWIRRCNSLTANDFETHSRLYRELDAQRLDFIEFFLSLWYHLVRKYDGGQNLEA